MNEYLAELKELKKKKNNFISANELTELTKPSKPLSFDSNVSFVSEHAENEKNILSYTCDVSKPSKDNLLVSSVSFVSDDKVKDLETIRQWMTDGGRPSNDYLFRLIIEKCERDPEARARFTQEALATKARLLSNAEAGQQPIVNEKVARLSDRDDRRYCNDCVFLDRNGRCKQWQKTNPHNSRYRPVPDVLRRCHHFKAIE